MKPASAKAKGRTFQQWVRDLIINRFGLDSDDVRSTSMGAAGSDILLSSKAKGITGLRDVECKHHARIAVYRWWEQALARRESTGLPILVIKENRKQPLVVCDAEEYFHLRASVARHLQELQNGAINGNQHHND